MAFRVMDEQEQAFYIAFGEWMKRARGRKRWPVEKMAKKLGLSHVSVMNVERGRQRLHLHQYAIVCSVLGCEPGAGVGVHLVENYTPSKSRAGGWNRKSLDGDAKV